MRQRKQMGNEQLTARRVTERCVAGVGGGEVRASGEGGVAKGGGHTGRSSPPHHPALNIYYCHREHRTSCEAREGSDSGLRAAAQIYSKSGPTLNCGGKSKSLMTEDKESFYQNAECGLCLWHHPERPWR